MTETMAEDRWDRLARDLNALGYGVSVTRRPFAEDRRGRVVHGVSASIMVRHPSGGWVEIHDKWWNKNADVWVGWEVHREGADSIQIGRSSRWTKKRHEAVAAFVNKMGEA